MQNPVWTLSGTVVSNVVHLRLVRRWFVSGHGFNRAETTAKRVAASAAGDAGAKAQVDAAPPSGTTEVVP